MKVNFLERFLKNIQKSNFMKIRPVEAEVFCAGGHHRRFRHFADAHKHHHLTPFVPYRCSAVWQQRVRRKTRI
jgi:hypothetical protein